MDDRSAFIIDGEREYSKKKGEEANQIQKAKEGAVNELLKKGGYLVDWKPSADGETVSRDQYLKLLVGGKYGDDRLVLYRKFCGEYFNDLGGKFIEPEEEDYQPAKDLSLTDRERGLEEDCRAINRADKDYHGHFKSVESFVEKRLSGMREKRVSRDVFNKEARLFAVWLMEKDLDGRKKNTRKR